MSGTSLYIAFSAFSSVLSALLSLKLRNILSNQKDKILRQNQIKFLDCNIFKILSGMKEDDFPCCYCYFSLDLCRLLLCLQLSIYFDNQHIIRNNKSILDLEYFLHLQIHAKCKD